MLVYYLQNVTIVHFTGLLKSFRFINGDMICINLSSQMLNFHLSNKEHGTPVLSGMNVSTVPLLTPGTLISSASNETPWRIDLFLKIPVYM